MAVLKDIPQPQNADEFSAAETKPNMGPERISSPEKLYEMEIGGFTISGKAGTGKTSLAEALGKLLNVPEENIIFTGQIVREITGGGRGFMKRELSVDQQIDDMQRELIVGASPQYPFIVEGRLAGVIKDEEEVRNPELKFPSILLVAPTETRMRRILRRERSSQSDKITYLERRLNQVLLDDLPPEEITSIMDSLLLEKAKKISLNDVKKSERARETGDLGQWRKLHKQLEGVDVFNPDNKDANGNHIYDLVINTGRMDAEEVLQIVIDWCLERGHIRKVNNQSEPMARSI